MKIGTLIDKKKHGFSLSKEEISFVIEEYCNGVIPDYQMSALLMAIYFKGMTPEETYDLTIAMMQSGEVLDLTFLEGTIIDKHSTGGIGDKISLIVAPLWWQAGLKVAKMSGRGLGFTGGTVDKLESIPGFKVNLGYEAFLHQVKTSGIAITGQSGNLVPADKKLYALRDVTETVDSLPLIASSIMSKKLATSGDVLVLDVKYGNGTFMKTFESAVELGEAMVAIGEKAGRKVAAILSPMENPLGCAVGNSLEILEAVEVLSGGGSRVLRENVIVVAAVGFYISGYAKTLREAMNLSADALDNGSAKKAFYEFIQIQGGHLTDDTLIESLPLAKNRREVKAKVAGKITDINALGIGIASMELGAGRKELGDKIHYGAGIRLKKQIGDSVAYGDVLAELYSDKPLSEMKVLACLTEQSFTIGKEKEHGIDDKYCLIYHGEHLNLKKLLNEKDEK